MTSSSELACKCCQHPISDQFFLAHDHPYCPTCKVSVFDQQLGCAGYLPSLGLGFLAAILGAALDFSVTVATDTQYGLIALIMGGLIGWGVRKGSRGRGGRVFQVMAVGLTYLAISVSLASLVVKEVVSPSDPSVAVSPAPNDSLPDVSEIFGETPTPEVSPKISLSAPTVAEPEAAEPKSSPTPVVAATPGVDTESKEQPQDHEPLTGMDLVITIVVTLAFGLLLPIAAVFLDPINGLFYLVAMWQAGSMAKSVTPDGPHSVLELGAEEASAPETNV
jgi:hypothetical protein